MQKGQKLGKWPTNFQDLKGRRIGRWTVVKCLATPGDKIKKIWQCVCLCGSLRTLSSSQLSGKRSLSCGCFRQEQSIKARTLPRDEAFFRAARARMKDSARKRNIKWLCTDEFLKSVYKQNCYYCDAPPQNVINSAGQEDLKFLGNWQGLDRKDSSAHYSDDNCVPCCPLCNRMKSNLHHDEFLITCRKIAGKVH